MKTREEIRIELEAANPTTNIGGVVYYPGDAQYEELMEQWIDAVLQMPPPPPIVVSMRSFREACGRELTSEISAYIATIEDLDERFKAQNDFEFAATVSRVNFRVSQIASGLGKTETEIDEVFALAQQLDAA
jgi:hypothetical protein